MVSVSPSVVSVGVCPAESEVGSVCGYGVC